MRFTLHSDAPAAASNLLTVLAEVGASAPAAGASAETGEVSSFLLFEAGKFYRERFGRGGESTLGAEAARDYADLQFKVLAQVAGPELGADEVAAAGREIPVYALGQAMNWSPASVRHVISGRHGSLEYAVYESGMQDLYVIDPEGEPFPVDHGAAYADELLALWRAQDDEAIARRMIELYALVMPRKPLPLFVILTKQQKLRDWARPATDPHRLVRVPEGVYRLLPEREAEEDGGRLRLVLDLSPETGSVGSTHQVWQELAETLDGEIDLVYIRATYSWMAVREGDDEERRLRDGQPFSVIGVPLIDQGITTSYRVRFADGYETSASPEEVELLV